MATVLTLHANAKVNLYLHVTGKRDDGYHLLDSLVAFPKGIHDVLTFAPSDRFSLTADGPFSAALALDETNIIAKTVHAFAQATKHASNVAIHVTKNIPLGSGLGGGSADAAATVLGLQKFWGVTLPDDMRDDLLLKLGADVPVCYRGYACRFEGIGEKISSQIDLPSLHVALIWPGVSSFTKDVFSRYKNPYRPSVSLPALNDSKNLISFLEKTENSLQAPAEELHPDIIMARHHLSQSEGCLLARMSGSGSTVFGLFDDESACKQAVIAAQSAHPSWWCRQGRL